MKKSASSSTSMPAPAPAVAMAGVALSRQLRAVAQAWQGIGQGRSGTAVLELVPAALRPGVQALLFQALRQRGLAQALARQLAPRKPAPAVDALLCVALALCADPEQPLYEPFTLVNQTVEAAKQEASTRAQAGFLNACLRRFLRESATLLAQVQHDEQARWNHPPWWVQRLRQDHPTQWQAILQANGQQAPMVLRVNVQKTTVPAYWQALEVAGIAASPVGEVGLVLQRAVPVQQLPGFEQGWVSVQDAAAQLAAPLLLAGLDVSQPLRVLDACAAPGGKTAHLLEYAGAQSPLKVTALEIDPQRAQRIGGTLARLGVQAQAQVVVADASRPQDWWQQHCAGALFDAILLDAPCTASGIVRRHPDVPWLRRESDIAQLAHIQARLLDTLWPLLQPGGRLLYCTCSVFKAEGAGQVQAFLARHSNACHWPSPGHLLPGIAPVGANLQNNQDHTAGEHDGFFYALLQKASV